MRKVIGLTGSGKFSRASKAVSSSKKISIFICIHLWLIFLCFSAFAQTNQPRTVRDFFMLLPDKYFSLDCCYHMPAVLRKTEYLKRYLNVEDPANGYLSGYGDAAQEGFAMALFKRPDGAYLIGFYTYGEGGVEDTPWCVFLNYRNGRWIDVSKTTVPNYDPKKYIYELPRRGTTIEVFQKDENGEGFYKGVKLHDLEWKGGKFTVKK